jgi:hypothetical protein
MQKLVTIYFDNSAYGKGKGVFGSFADKHGLVEEHLKMELSDGWRVASLSSFGGHNDGLIASGWLAVLLEKS